MNLLQTALLIVGVFILVASPSPSLAKSTIGGKSIDLEDYIDNGKPQTSPEKKGDLSVSETGYYPAYPYHHGYHHHLPTYHHHGYHHQPHGYHGHHHLPHHHYGHDHAHTYLNGEYGGHGHIGSAHVSFGSEINHGYAHPHHHYG